MNAASGSLTVDYFTGLPVTGSIDTRLRVIQPSYSIAEEINSSNDNFKID